MTGGVRERAAAARRAAARLARSTPSERNDVLAEMAEGLRKATSEILEANAVDCAAAAVATTADALSPALLQRLKLERSKLEDLVLGLEQLRVLPDPLGVITLARELDAGLELRRVTCPIGVVGVIFESRPDALVQIAGLCLKSGNAVLLKGGSEAEQSNRVLARVLRAAIEGLGLPGAALQLLEGRAEVAELLQAEADVDLIVPRGSSALVRAIREATSIPVLGHAEGVCHVYVDRRADLAQALAVAVDAKVQYPSACNAVETVLVHAAIAAKFVPALVNVLRAHGVEVRADPRALALVSAGDVVAADGSDWDAEYGEMIVALRIVDDLDAALEHISRHGSRHTEAIVTADRATWERFAAEVDAAGVFWNASTRFADGFRYGFGAELGIATGKLHPRGPVGLEGLVTYKYRLEGNGHRVSDYAGPAARPFSHRDLDH